MLCCGGALSASSLPTIQSHEPFIKSIVPSDKKLLIFLIRLKMNMTNECISMLLVVLVFFLTTTYKMTRSPLEGVLSPSPLNIAEKTFIIKTYFLLLYFTNTMCFYLSVFIIYS
jgi:hypothetical protein